MFRSGSDRNGAGPGFRRTKAGFSLVEVSLAVLVIGLGLIVVFGLFPSGLRSSEEGNKDTRAALFADYVFNGMAANASKITSWREWTDASLFPTLSTAGVAMGDGARHTVEYPAGSGYYVQYRLTIEPGTAGHTASLEVSDGQTGPFPMASFYNGFIYSGM